jgi:sugar (pentulose or hexulose) kinase
MAKHCTNCGHELLETDKFCAECGTAVGGTATQAQPQQWDYCEIVWTRHGFWGWQSYFWAKNLGTGKEVLRGNKTFGPNYDFHNQPYVEKDKNSPPALDEIERLLISSGWEPNGHGTDGWYNQQFRRPMRS